MCAISISSFTWQCKDIQIRWQTFTRFRGKFIQETMYHISSESPEFLMKIIIRKFWSFFCTHCTATTTTAAKQFVQRNKSRINRSLSAVGLAALTHPISDVHYCKYIHVNSSDMSLHFKLAKPSADRVFTDSESQTVGAATVEARDATEASTRGR